MNRFIVSVRKRRDLKAQNGHPHKTDSFFRTLVFLDFNRPSDIYLLSCPQAGGQITIHVLSAPDMYNGGEFVLNLDRKAVWPYANDSTNLIRKAPRRIGGKKAMKSKKEPGFEGHVPQRSWCLYSCVHNNAEESRTRLCVRLRRFV